MPRTTLMIEESLLAEIRRRAVDEQRSMQEVTNDLLRLALSQIRAPYKLELHHWRGALQPGVDLLDRDSLFDLMDGR